MAEGLAVFFAEARRARTLEEIDAALEHAHEHVRRHPDDEEPVSQACEMLAMKRESIELFGAASV